jgi:outer membrane protein assembly factor BamD
MLDELRRKLEKKSFMTSKQYYRIGRYKAAVTSLENTLLEYPDTKYREEALFVIVKSYYEWSENSVDSKKEERYSNTKKAYFKFAAAYPESYFSKEAKKVLEEAEEELEKFLSKKA